MRLHFGNISLNRETKNSLPPKQTNYQTNLIYQACLCFIFLQVICWKEITLSKNQPLQTEQLIFQKITSSCQIFKTYKTQWQCLVVGQQRHAQVGFTAQGTATTNFCRQMPTLNITRNYHCCSQCVDNCLIAELYRISFLWQLFILSINTTRQL